MRARLAAVAAALVVLAGCGDDSPPDQATSRGLVESVVLDWHRFQAEGDGEAGCRLLTDEGQAEILKLDRDIAKSLGTARPDSCAAAVAKIGRWSEESRQVLRDTEIDAVRVDGARATVTAHTSAVVNGVRRQTPPVDIRLRWQDDRWLLG